MAQGKTSAVSKKTDLSVASLKTFSGSSLSNKKIKVVLVIVVIAALLFLSKSFFVAALVNGRPVSRLAVVQQLEKQGGKSVLDNLITENLILQEASKRHIAVTQSESDAELKKIQTNVESQGGTLDAALAAQGMTKAQLTEQLKLQLLVNKMVGTDAPVSDKEIDDYITANKAQLPQNQDEATLRTQVRQQLVQQKLQQKIQTFVQDLKTKAKITYLVSY